MNLNPGHINWYDEELRRQTQALQSIDYNLRNRPANPAVIELEPVRSHHSHHLGPIIGLGVLLAMACTSAGRFLIVVAAVVFVILFFYAQGQTQKEDHAAAIATAETRLAEQLATGRAHLATPDDVVDWRTQAEMARDGLTPVRRAKLIKLPPAQH